MVVIAAESLRWLVEWGQSRYDGPDAPFGLPGPVMVLHPFETPDGSEEHSWREMASYIDIDLDQMLRGAPPDPRLLRARRPARLHELNLPAEGFAPKSIRRMLVSALGGLDQPVTVGLYGGWGQPAGIETSIGPIEVTGLEYWFTTANGAEFLRTWATDEDYATTGRWENVVSFVWPRDHTWFLHIDPDAFHTSLYTDHDALRRLVSTGLETFQPSG